MTGLSRFGFDAVIVLVGIAVLWLLAFASWGLFRGFERLARWRLRRLYDDPELRAYPAPGDVGLSYTTFHGLLAWFTPVVHMAYGPPDHILRLLGRLFRFTLVWGLLTWGAPFYLIGAITYYLRERREIASQAAAGGFDPEQGESVEGLDGRAAVVASRTEPLAIDASNADNPYAAPQFIDPIVEPPESNPPPSPPSPFLAFFGLLAMPIGLIIAVGSVTMFGRGEYGFAFAGLAMGTFIGLTGFGWVRAAWQRRA